MATTTIQPLPYPLPGDPADGPAQFKALAEAVEGRVVMRFPSLAARDAALPGGTLVDGMMCHVAADNAVYVRAGGQWRLMWRALGPTAFTFTGGSGTYSRRGDLVEVRWSYANAIAAGDTATSTAVIPAELRPASTSAAAAMLTYSTGATLHGEVTTAGTLAVKNSGSAAASSCRGQAVYLVS